MEKKPESAKIFNIQHETADSQDSLASQESHPTTPPFFIMGEKEKAAKRLRELRAAKEKKLQAEDSDEELDMPMRAATQPTPTKKKS